MYAYIGERKRKIQRQSEAEYDDNEEERRRKDHSSVTQLSASLASESYRRWVDFFSKNSFSILGMF